MQILIQCDDRESKQLKLLEENQTFIIESSGMTFRARKFKGDIVMEIIPGISLRRSGESIVVAIPQNAVTANQPLFCSAEIPV